MDLCHSSSRLNAHGGFCVLTVGLFSETYALQIEIVAGYSERRSPWRYLAKTKIRAHDAERVRTYSRIK